MNCGNEMKMKKTFSINKTRQTPALKRLLLSNIENSRAQSLATNERSSHDFPEFFQEIRLRQPRYGTFALRRAPQKSTAFNVD